MYSDIPMLRAEDLIPDISGINITKMIINDQDNITTLHWHNYYTLDLVENGCGEHYLNGTIFPIKRGDAYIVRPTDMHYIIGSNIQLRTVRFLDNTIPQNLKSFIRNSRPSFELSDKTLCRMITFADAAMEYNAAISGSADNSFAIEAVHMLFSLMIITLAENYSYTDVDMTDRLNNIMHWIDVHYRENPSIDEAASAIGLSPAYFSVWFKANSGISYTSRLTSLRISYACSLLKQGFSVVDSCFSSGFGSLSYFNNVFKKHIGISPGKYKKESMHKTKNDLIN